MKYIISFLAQLLSGVIGDALKIFTSTKVESVESALDIPATSVDVLVDKYGGLFRD